VGNRDEGRDGSRDRAVALGESRNGCRAAERAGQATPGDLFGLPPLPCCRRGQKASALSSQERTGSCRQPRSRGSCCPSSPRLRSTSLRQWAGWLSREAPSPGHWAALSQGSRRTGTARPPLPGKPQGHGALPPGSAAPRKRGSGLPGVRRC